MRAIFGAIIARSVARTGSPESGYAWLRRLDANTREYVLNPTILYQKIGRQEGTVTIAKEETPEKLAVVQTLKTQKLARTMTLDPTSHRIFLSTADLKPPASPAPSPTPQRQAPLPGTFRVLVYSPER